jgi:hypothetical protein
MHNAITACQMQSSLSPGAQGVWLHQPFHDATQRDVPAMAAATLDQEPPSAACNATRLDAAMPKALMQRYATIGTA